LAQSGLAETTKWSCHTFDHQRRPWGEHCPSALRHSGVDPTRPCSRPATC